MGCVYLEADGFIASGDHWKGKTDRQDTVAKELFDQFACLLSFTYEQRDNRVR